MYHWPMTSEGGKGGVGLGLGLPPPGPPVSPPLYPR